MTPLYLYPLWVRVWHWGNSVLFIILTISGAALHFANGSGIMTFKLWMLIHNTTGVLLAIAWLVFVLGNLITGNGRHYRIRFTGLYNRLLSQSYYYVIGIFRGESHPFQVTAESKFNALQQLSYIGIMYGLMPVLIISGLSFLFPAYLPDQMLGIGSIWVVAMVHLTMAYLGVMFLLIHVYIITTGTTIFSNLHSMLTGWHR